MTRTFDLTPEQHDEFERRGVVRLPGFYPRADIDVMADRLWTDLETRYRLRRDRPESWTVVAPTDFQALKRSGAFRALGSPALFGLADALLGAGSWDRPANWGIPLVTFPTRAPVLPRPPWHLDLAGRERLDPLPTLRVFIFLEPAPPHGGGTLYVSGSHRLAMAAERAQGGPVKSAQVRDRLKAEHPWFARLFAAPTSALRALMDEEAEAGGHPVQLEEMTGAPGDLIVMHPAILHGSAHNARERPRMMLTEWIPRRDGGAD
ncbi:MAG: phytanoyl-CoA dioxygenase family protein [Caulobacteraceae bacterium]